jgi:polyferredoxin
MFKRALRPRVLIYGAVLSAASVAFAASVALRSPFKFDVVKDRGTLARIVDDGAVENVYRIEIMNRTEKTQTYRVSASGIDGLVLAAPQVSAGPASVTSVVVSLKLPYEAAQLRQGTSPPVVFQVVASDAVATVGDGGTGSQHETSTFFVPR